MEEKIIAKALEQMKADFMQYNSENIIESEFSICDAITFFVAEQMQDEASDEIYDFIITLFNANKDI